MIDWSACPAVERDPGRWVLMGFVNERDGSFVGVIDDPLPVSPSGLPGVEGR